MTERLTDAELDELVREVERAEAEAEVKRASWPDQAEGGRPFYACEEADTTRACVMVETGFLRRLVAELRGGRGTAGRPRD